MSERWTPDSWRTRKVLQVPEYPDAKALADVEAQLRAGKGFAIATPEFATIGKMIAQIRLPMLVVQEGGYPSPSLGLNLASLLKGLGA